MSASRNPNKRKDGPGCGKVRYAKRSHAEEVLRSMLREGVHGRNLHIYRCPYCSGYHVGHDRRFA